MWNDDDRKWLYEQMRKNGVNTGSYDDFTKSLDNKEDRDWYYQKSRSLGLNVGSADDFASMMVQPVQKPAPAQPVVKQTTGQVNPTVNTSTQPKQDEQPQKQGGWQPTWQEKMGMQMQLDETMRQVKQSQQDFNTRMENIRKGNTLGKTSEVKFNPESGKMERRYYTTHGDEVTTPLEQSRLNLKYRDEWEATTPEGRKHREKRIENDFERRVGASLDKYDPDNAAAMVWQQAEDKSNEEFGRYLDERSKPSWSNFLRGAAEGTSVTGGLGADNVDTGIKAFATHLKYHDLQRMADDAWNMLGKEKQQSIIEDMYGALKNRYPQATEQQLQQAATEMAREQSDRRMYELAVAKNAPKDAAEYFIRKVAAGNAMGTLMQAAARAQAGTTGDWEAREDAEQRFEKQGHKVAGIAGTVTGFALDPLTWASAGAGGAAVKGTTWLGGKMIGEAAMRKFGTTLGGRMLGGAIGGAVNFGTYEAGSEALDQMKWGGYIDEETGERKDGFSFGNVAGRAGHGLMMGAVTGVIAPYLGNVSDKLVRATESTVGKMGIRAGELGVGTVAEGTIFAVPEIINTYGQYGDLINSLSDETSPNYIADEQERAAKIEELRNSRGDALMDVWTDNMAMIAGFKAQHLLKSAPRVIYDLARSKNGKAGFETRLRSILDGRGDLALTEDEKKELERRGYGDLKDLTEEYSRYAEAKEEYDKARPTTTDASRMIEGGDGQAELPYNRFVELMTDNSVSEAARAKMYYYLTGHGLPMSTVMGSSILEDKDADGNVTGYTVQSFGANGVITSRSFGDKKRADVEVNRINRQAELNGFDVGERYYDWQGDNKRMYEACETVAEETGAPANLLFDLMKRKTEAMNEVELEWAEKILNAYNGLGDKYGSSEVRTAINEEFGVDVDKAIRKERNRRSEQEQKAVDEYASRLFADVKRKQEEAAERGEAPVDPDAPTSNSQIAALLGIDDGEQGDPVSAAFNRGHEADAQERQDIAIELTDPNNAEAQEAWNGVVQRINEDAAYMVAQQREQTKQMQHTDGSLRPAILKEKDSEGNDQQVYIVDGNVQMMPDGSVVDKASSDNIVVIYNPATGERKQIDPSADTGISSLGEVTTAEQREADIERSRQEYVQAQIDEAQGTVRFVPGQQLVLPTGEEAVVVATDADGENITVALGDGTQATVQRSELQRIRDEKAAAEYRQRHGITEEPATQQPEASASAQPQTDGRVAGAPADYTADMELTIRDEDGSEKPAMVMGRVRYENGSFVPDANGNIIEYFMDGEVKHDHEDKLVDKVVSHVAPQQPEAAPVQEASAETPATVETTPPPVEQQAEVAPQPVQEPVQTVEPQPTQPAEAPAQPIEQPTAEPMPVGEDGEEDWQATTPERAHAYIFNEAGLSRSEGNEFIAAQTQAAQSALVKAKSAQMPRVGTSIKKYNEAKAKRQEKIDEAQRVLDYWQQVRNIQNDIQRVENERRAAEDAVRHDEAVAEAQAEYEARKQAEAERKAVGNENPMPAITEKWNNATKVDGHRDEIMLPDGTPLKGHYVLHESGASSPSHNPETWQKTDGFPMDANDNSVNDRDYERDHDAQEHTQSIARQYDQRALQSVPVVSNDGVVLSGNGRTMAGELAARDNTDGAYVNYLKEYAPKFGFTPEQVEAMQHPRVSFVPDEAMPYTAETFAKFNQQEMKSQNKTEQAVKLGKTVNDDSFKGIVRTINGYDTLGDFYNDAEASLGAVYDLHNAGVVPQAQLAEMVDGVRGQEKLSAVGREFLENMLIGKAFESDPEVVRMLTAEPAMRQTVITALGEIVDNIALGGDWSLQGELADAVKLCFDARQGGAKYGEIVSTYARQGVLFADPDELQTVADFNNATMLMLADVLNDKRVTLLKTTLQLYNNNARQSAVGQADLFAGGIQSREDILRDVITFINENYGKRKEIEAARAEAVERRKAESVQQDGTPPAVSTDGEATAEPSAEHAPVEAEPVEATEPVEAEPNAVQTALAAAEQETNTEPTEAQKEAGNYKKGHVKIDGYDVTIENPKGSVRRGTDASGKQWEQEMQNTYGYIRGTEGVDGDHIDVFFSEDPSQGDVFVVDQVNKDGSFDEHKVMYGFPDIESARKAYLSNYEDGWQGLGAITPVSKEEFKKWIDSSHRKTKPFAEYSSVKPFGDTQLGEQPKEPTVKAGEDYVSAAERIARENEVKRTAAHFAEETQEEAAAFDKRVPEMDDAELLAYMQEDGMGDVNKAHHPSVYDEYDYRHGDEQLQSYDDTLVRLNESGTTLEQAEEMLANIQKDVSRLATEDRAMLLGQEEALQEYIAGLEKILYDRQGNPVDADGNLILEEISSVDELKGEDFSNPTRNVQLPKIPENVDKAIGAGGKPVIIKKNIFEKNARDHRDLKPSQSREILKTALYTPDLYGQNQQVSRPYNYVVISTKGADGKNKLVLLEVNNGKENVEIVHWHYIRDKALETLKRQAEREGGHILILPSDNSKEAGGLSSRTLDLSSIGKGSDLFGNEQGSGKKSSSDGKIDDVGEVLAGARKDMRKEIAKSLANVTEAALVEKPFGKVYKKPDLKKAVESGALREKDAIFYEALFSMVNQQKPKVTQSEMRSKRYIPDFKTKAERWAADTFEQMEVLRQFMELDEPGRDALMERMLADRYPTREQELAEIEKRKGWNPDYEGHKYEWGEMTTPNPLWVTHEVMNRLGYSVGDKLDVPYGVVKANTSGTGYSIENLKGERASLFGSGMTLDEAIDRIVYLAKLKRGDADVSHPTQLFAFPATKSESGESGRYRVMWGRDYKTREFDSKEDADAFAQTKNGAYVSPIMETKRKFGYKVRFTHPLTGEKMFVDDAEFDTKEEAQAYFDGNFEKLNEATNAKLQEEREKKGEKKTLTADDVVHVTMVHSAKGGWTHAVVIDKKYANNDGQVRIIKEGFASRKDAKSFADSVKDDVLKTVLKHKEDAKKIVYFDTGENSRIGEDYRNGKDVDAEDFMNTFGFRGVQFGNWTNQADRQMAVNQAYDAFMDMARLIGVSPKAMSLNGELGIAFGARGVGGFAAHYEPGEVVINLTKTQGAGSLAHEWWHALDNYFARRAGSADGMVTDSRRIEMRDALRKAFNDMVDLVNGSDYAQRSAAKGEYWGRTHEITARLLAEWVDRELKKRGELNTFLSRGAVVERGQQHNYDVYEVLERLAGREPMPFEEYKELPESLKGIPYPSAKEVEQFGGSLRHIFDTLEEKVDEETGNVMLYEPTATYETRDGEKVVCRSLFDEMGVRSSDEVAMVSQHIQQGQGQNQVIAPSEIRLRKLKKGETCHVERVYEETKQFDFTGKEKVESAEDVAYIFRQLENAAVENSFLVLVKDGRPTVIHLGVGSYVGVMAPFEQTLVAYRELNPEQVYFVHNHPSGVLKASLQDQELLKRVKMAFGEDVVQQGIIIDTTSGKYGEFDMVADNYDLIQTSGVEAMPQSEGADVPVKVYQFSRQVFAPDWNPESAFKIVSSQSVAEFVSSHRLGEHKKMSFLVVDNNGNVVANVFLPWTKLSDIKRSKDAGDLLAGYVHQCGGVRGVLYGNYDYEADDRAVLAAVGGRMRQLNAPLMDALHVEHSAYESGWAGVGEPKEGYGVDARDVAQSMDDNNGTEVVRFIDFLRRGRLEQGESRYFHVGETGDILNEHGISGKITIGTSAVNSHHNEDAYHLDENDWVEVIEKINEPVAITEYGDRGNSFRIYTIVEKNGKNICVGVDVNSVGRDVNITNIRTAFARDIANALNERLVYPHSRTELETAIRELSLRHNREVYPEQPYDAANIRNNSETQTQNEENLLLGRDGEYDDDIEQDSTMQEDRDMMRSAVQQMGEKLHTDINIIEDVNEITHPNAEIQEQRRRAKGWYDRVTRQVYVVLPNNRDVDDAKVTTAHETIAHKGLRELVGEENYDEFLDETYQHLRDDLKKGVDDAAGRAFIDDTTKNGKRAKSYEQHRRTAVDELFGRMAEKPFEEFSDSERTLWQKIKATVRRLLDKFLGSLKLPKWFELGDNELRYILWRSKERLERGKEHPIDLARDIVKREELGLTDEARYNMGDAPETFKARQRRAAENKGTVMPGLNDAQVKVVDVPRHPFTGTGKQAIEKARIWANGNLVGSHTAHQVGNEFDYSIDEDAVKKFLSSSSTLNSDNLGVHLAVLTELPEIINESIEVEEHPDYKKINRERRAENGIDNPNLLVHRMYGAVDIDGIIYRVKTTMHEHYGKGNGPHDYRVTKVELLISGSPTSNALSNSTGELLDGQTTKPLSVSSRKSNTPNDSHGLNSELEAHDLNGSKRANGYVHVAKLLQNVGKSYEKEKKLLDESKIADESTDLYRDPDETEDIWTDGSLGLDEMITRAAVRLSDKHRDDKTMKQDAYRAIGGNLTKLRQAMALQKRFDQTTVKRVSDLARVLISSGYLNNLTAGEIKSLLSAVKNSVGHNDIEGDVQKVMDIMVDNQLKHAEDTLHELEAIRGSKVDARGVEVQGQLDPAGQTMLKAMKAAQKIVIPCGGKTHDENGVPTAWGNALESVQMRMSSEDQALAEAASQEYAGMQLAQQWFDTIQVSELEEHELREELKTGYVDENGVPINNPQGKREWRAGIEEAIRQNKIERAQSYFDLVGRLSDSLRESIANAKDFKEAEKQRIREIQHNANSDMEGRPSDEHQMPANTRKKMNNFLGNSLFAPLATYMEMLRLFGRKSANGEGYLFNRFGRGWIDARQKEIKGVRDKYAILDAKAAELFGGKVKTWGDLIRRVGKLPTGTVSFWNGGEMQERELTQGNLMYIYMVNKMLDGRMKLRKMGITEENVADIEEVLDPRLLELADWLQDEFLVQTRNEYNETHKRMFGASMAAIEHYFPLRVLKNAIDVKAEDLDKPEVTDGISTITGSIIKRRRNSKPLDILNADALHVILSHVAEMEHWNAYAEFNRDLNTLRSYRRFRNQVQNMNTIYGNGKKLWDKFNDVCQMATGAYKPKGDGIEKAVLSAAQGVTAAKVSFRIYTALKQFASFPAYIPYVRADYLARALVRPDVSWSWCMEHLPIFEERWKSRVSGDPRLAKSILTAADWRQNLAVKIARAGMVPNAFVDALTVSMGAYAVYQTRKGQYLRDGYSEEQAERRAIQDAEIVYNETQQSGESAFTSTMQTDRTWWKVMFSIFRNASMAYQRQLHGALRDLGNVMKKGGVSERLSFMKKQYVRDGIDEAQAEQNAKRKLYRQFVKDGLAVATFGYIMQLAWNITGYLPYLLFGDDDETKDEFWDDIWTHTMGGWLEGLTGGDVMSLGIGMWLSGEVDEWKLKKEMPLTTDLFKTGSEFLKGEFGAFVTDAVNLCVQIGLGVNPQSITDVALSIMDACGDDPALAHEATICISRILQVPQSQIDKMYFDEVGLSGDEVSKYTPAQLAERYAQFKVKRGRFFSPWSWGDEERIKKFTDKANKTIKERTEQMGDDKVNEAYLQYEEVYKGVDAKVKEAKKTAKTDYVEAAQLMADAQSDPNAFATYQMFKQMDGNFNKIVKFYLGAKTPDEAALCRQAVLDYKSAMVKVLDAPDAATRAEAMGNLGNVMQEFTQKYVPMQQPNR